MTARRDEIVRTIWQGSDPFAERSAFRGRVDPQGWQSDHPYLARAVEEISPAVVTEIGVWKGGSVVTLADAAKRLGLDSVVIAVDTWLGAFEHWFQPQWFANLRMESGYPTLFKTFAANVLERGLDDYVVPLPLDSLNACELFGIHGIAPDLLHIDGGHSYESVSADLRVWWARLKVGGILIGDDYHPDGVEVWPEVRRAFQDFFGTKDIENSGGKCYVRKLG